MMRHAATSKRYLVNCLHLIASIALLALLVSFGATPHAEAGLLAQAWGQSANGSYWGVNTIMSTPNPNLGMLSWSGGPSAVTNTVSKFMESGPSKNLSGDQGLHPYGNYGNASGSSHTFVDTSRNLTAGAFYRYKTVFLVGSNTFQAQFCDGSGSCYPEQTGNLAVTQLPYVVSGGESSGADVHWGSLTTAQTAQYEAVNGSTWINWCYAPPGYTNVSGTVSACSSPYYSWVSSY